MNRPFSAWPITHLHIDYHNLLLFNVNIKFYSCPASQAWMEWLIKKRKTFDQRGDMAVAAWAEKPQSERISVLVVFLVQRWDIVLAAPVLSLLYPSIGWPNWIFKMLITWRLSYSLSFHYSDCESCGRKTIRVLKKKCEKIGGWALLPVAWLGLVFDPACWGDLSNSWIHACCLS